MPKDQAREAVHVTGPCFRCLDLWLRRAMCPLSKTADESSESFAQEVFAPLA